MIRSTSGSSSEHPQAAPRIERERLDRGIERSQAYFLREFIPADGDDQPVADAASTDLGYWHAELEADTTLESDYLLFLYYLDPEGNREKIEKLATRIQRCQLEDGSWNIYYGGPGEISASVKAYFALKLAGVPVTDPLMVRARDAILAMGGAERVNSFTKIYLSFLNQFDWKDCPAIPPEIVLLPRFLYFNIYEISYWSRAILVPLSILYDRKPRRTPPGIRLDEIFTDGGEPEIESGPNGNVAKLNGHAPGLNGNGTSPALGASLNGNGAESRVPRKRRLNGIPRDPNLFSWKNFFLLIDQVLKLAEHAPLKPLRSLAVRKAEKWMLDRFEKSDGLGAIFPSMVNSVIALHSLGYDVDHPHIANTLEKLRELEIDEGDSIRLQPCLSPVWDTALALNALGEAGLDPEHPVATRAIRWMVSKEATGPGDWQVRKPGVEASGWYFQFNNEFYPDVDDSAAVLMAMERFDLSGIEGGEESLRRGLKWILSMQCSDGGWAAFDVDINREILCHVPFADHNAMLDPTCSDITGRTLECLGRLPSIHDEPGVQEAIDRAVQYLRNHQEDDGSWYGRWGVNYIYGTWQSLKGLVAVGVPLDDPVITRGAGWLRSVQNDDGGWGESCESYEAEGATRGLGPSTASQTAWAVMGLIAAGEAETPAVTRGIQYLLDHQNEDGTWTELEFTGTGFPLVFYLRYHMYPQYFPLFALAMYRNSIERRDEPSANRNFTLYRSESSSAPLVKNGFARPPANGFPAADKRVAVDDGKGHRFQERLSGSGT